jgi:hypothetical protein
MEFLRTSNRMLTGPTNPVRFPLLIVIILANIIAIRCCVNILLTFAPSPLCSKVSRRKNLHYLNTLDGSGFFPEEEEKMYSSCEAGMTDAK